MFCATPRFKNCAAFLQLAALVAGCLYHAAGPAAAQTLGWHSPSWQYRKTITIDRTKVAGGAALADFPLLVAIDADADLAARAQADGDDILFTGSDGVTKLAHELERYVPSSGLLVAWVKLPSLSPAADTTVYLYYGNPAAAPQQAPADAWNADYRGVWHMKNATSTTVADSTFSVNTGIKRSATEPAEGVGILDRAQVFDGQNDSVTLSRGTAIANNAAFTISAWFRTASAQSRQRIFEETGGRSEVYIAINGNTTGDFVFGVVPGGKERGDTLSLPMTLNDGQWHQLAAVQTSKSSRQVFVDGVAVASGSAAIGTVSTNRARIGTAQGNSWFFAGSIDEVRVSAAAHAAGRIATEYNNQRSPAAFYSLGPQTTNGVTDSTPPNVTITQPTAGAVLQGSQTVSANASDNVAVAGVQFRLDGADLGPEDTAAPYAAAWNTISTANGAHTLAAVARDAAGNRTTSAPVSVTVNNPDTAPPSVSITQPANGATVSGTQLVRANASDNTGVAGVQFRVDGANLGPEDTVAPYEASWNTAGVADGSHTITAVGRDAAGNTASATVTVTVTNADTTAPLISSVGANNPGATTATVTWLTNEPADSQVEYGLTTAYGSFTQLDTALATNHSAALSGLTPNTTYQYRVRSADVGGNVAVSPNASFTTAASSGGDWYSSAWQYRKKITVDRTKVSGQAVLSGFPVLIARASDPDLAARAQAGGGDILFTGSDGVTRLPHEVERYTASTGELAAWVKVPTLSPAADTVLYLYYGNPSAALQQTPAAVWDATYKGVWHLGESSGTLAADSTANAAHGVKASAAAPAPVAAGRVGGAQNFDGVSAFIEAAGVHNIPTGTVSLWINPSQLPSAGNERRMAAGFHLQTENEPYVTEDKIVFLSSTAIKGHIYDGGNQIVASSTPPAVNNWYHVALTFDGSAERLYINGSAEAVKAAGNSYSYSDPAFRIALLSVNISDGESVNRRFSGIIDEVRVSNIARTADWIRTGYNNQSAPATFISVGPQASNLSDTEAPAVTVVQPASGSTVSGSVTIAADASDNTGVAGVQFRVDGNPVGAEDTAAPYSVAWDSATAPNGAHVLSAVARDAAGNSTASAGVTVTVSNADATPPAISAVSAANITTSGATIAWTTNEPASSQVEYGTSTAYGLLSPLDPSLVTSHSVTLSGLSAGVTYNYRVRSRDGAGNLAVSGNFTFSTPPASPVTYTVMPLGDSITRGDTSHNSYRRPLWQKIQSGGYSANFVGDYSDNNGGPPPNPDFDLDNQAVSGIRADQWLPFDDVATHYRPQRVLLYLGVNDLYNGQSAASTYTDIGLLIDALRNANASVVVLVGKLYLTTDATLNARIQEFNNGLAAWVETKSTQQSPVIMVDHTNVNAATDTWDGLHPNALGEEKMAANWYSALSPYLR